MRLHITLEDELVRRLDRKVGSRRRSSFIASTIRQALDDQDRWNLIEASIGSASGDHEWDVDPNQWVRAQRQTDSRRVG